jgi:hypothetical protein
MKVHLGRAVCLAALTSLWLAVPALVMAGEDELSDEAMEIFLLDSEVVRVQQMLPGSTYPMAVELRMHGTVRKAVYKYRPADLPHTEDIAMGVPLADSYLYEVAAYRLDRTLGLGMVPVAVIRDIHAEGAVIEWISDAFTEQQLRERGDYPEDSQPLIQQRDVMNLFDALILNEDRKGSDQLITPEDWKLHLVDHSRAFPVSEEIPPGFLVRPASLSRALLHRLIELDTESLPELLAGLLTDTQIEALLERRDKILGKINSDRQKYGDAKVFQD